MVAVYVRMIRAGKMTIDDVPQRWRKAVEEALEE
jgi:hypothetical protein